MKEKNCGEVTRNAPSGYREPYQAARFLFCADALLRRHDDHVEASGGFAAAQYVSAPVTVAGITLPTKRRAYIRDKDLLPIHGLDRHFGCLLFVVAVFWRKQSRRPTLKPLFVSKRTRRQGLFGTFATNSDIISSLIRVTPARSKENGVGAPPVNPA